MDSNVTVNLMVTPDKMTASIRLVPPKDKNIEPVITEQAVLASLANVKYGLKEEVISFLVRGEHYNETYEIAKGKPPREGERGRIELKFDSVRDLKPKEREDGTVDYRDIGYVQNVMSGDVLAVRTPPTPGEPGINVLGVEVLPPKLQDVKLPQGKGTIVSED